MRVLLYKSHACGTAMHFSARIDIKVMANMVTYLIKSATPTKISLDIKCIISCISILIGVSFEILNLFTNPKQQD